MKILVAGATGAIGRRLIPLLIACGYEVICTTRAVEKAVLLQKLGASPVVVDALDRDGLATAVRDVQPDVVIHQLTDLAPGTFRQTHVYAGKGRVISLTRPVLRGFVDSSRKAFPGSMSRVWVRPTRAFPWIARRPCRAAT